MKVDYKDLINKKIEGTLSEKETDILNDILLKNEDASQYYNEMIKTINTINNLEEIMPPGDLKRNIMNSVDIDKYSKAQNRFVSFIKDLYALKPSPRVAVSFAFGSLVGILVISFFMMQKNFGKLNTSDLSGTIGNYSIKNMDVVLNVPINHKKIAGEIVIKQSPRIVVIQSDIQKAKYYELTLEFDGTKIRFNDFKPQFESKSFLEYNRDFIKIKGEKSSLFDLVFTKVSDKRQLFTILLSDSSDIIFDKKISF